MSDASRNNHVISYLKKQNQNTKQFTYPCLENKSKNSSSDFCHNYEAHEQEILRQIIIKIKKSETNDGIFLLYIEYNYSDDSNQAIRNKPVSF